MPTLVISDIHLGSSSRSDVLRVPALREPLLELAKGAERVVLLGDLLELLSVAAMSRLLARPAGGFATVEDYESVTSPIYAWRAAVGRDLPVGGLLDGQTTLRAWRALGGAGNRRRDDARPGRAHRSLA